MSLAALAAAARPAPELFLDDCRFYATTTADLNEDGLAEIIAVGQINRSDERQYSGLIALISSNGGALQKVNELSFNIVDDGQTLPTRIRDVRVIRDRNRHGWSLFTAGRGGEDEGGVGFLHHARFENNELVDKGYEVFHAPDAEGANGYPLATGDIDDDGNDEIIYGGFITIDGEDRADVRAFHVDGEGLSLIGLPFERLEIPLRVNALEAADVDNDGKAEIVIAGRTKRSEDLEISAFAWWSDGKVYHQVFEEERPSRLRAVMVADVDGDGTKELLTGGRMELGELWLADLRLWDLRNGKAHLGDRFYWSLGRQIRLRALSAIKDEPSHFNVGGRAEWSSAAGEVRWLGFVWEFSFDDGHLQPVLSPAYMDEGMETRVRHLHLSEWGDTIASGFTKTKENRDRGFVRILRADQ